MTVRFCRGPCSSDNEEVVLDYATHQLAKLQEEVKADKVFMVMRVYTAKPSYKW